jgi:thiamine biosynthesis lipoprotein
MLPSTAPNESRRARPLLGTLVDITVMGGAATARNDAISSAFSVIEKIHRLMSFQESTSDVSRLNREAVNAPVRVHRWTWEVLALANDVSSVSDGVFDITVAPHLVEHGFLPRIDAPATDPDARWSDVELLEGSRVRFRRPLWVDVGGIAKGFAVDRATETLASCGMMHAVVNAGGDLRAFGPRPQPIHVRHPSQPGRIVFLTHLENDSIATSAGYFARIGNAAPFVQPGSGRIYEGNDSVSVQNPACAVADALTKVVLMARDAAKPVLKHFKAVAHVIGEHSDGTPVTT